MAEYPIIMKQKNDQGQYDTLYPQTLGSQIQGNIQSSQIEGNIPSSQISGNIPSSQITGQFPASQINGIYTADETLTDAVASMFGFGTDAVPNQVLSILSSAALYKNVPLSEQPEGAIVYLEENSSLVPFIVSKQNYEPSYNTNRVLLARTSGVRTGAWNSAGTNALNGSTIDTWFNTTYLQTLGTGVQNAIGQTNIPYTPKNGVNTVERINKSVFTLSLTELDIQNDYTNIEGSALPTASTLKQLSKQVWTRSPVSDATNRSFYVHSNGIVVGESVTNVYSYYRPCFTLPGDFTGYIPSDGSKVTDILGNLLFKLPATQIETGSYVGTGTYGKTNPNTLTFGFVPKVWGIIFMTILGSFENVSAYVLPNIFYWGINNNYSISNITSRDNVGGYEFDGIEYTGNTVKWWKGQAEEQLNLQGGVYYYFAIG